MLGRVTRRVPDLQPHVADVDLVAVVQQACASGFRKCILPIRAALGGEQKLRAGETRQLAGAGHEIGVNVRLGDIRDRQLVLGRESDIAVDVAIRIDRDRGFRLLASQ